MSGKVTPCVTMMLCVAGCSATTSGGMPNARALPPPNFDQNSPGKRTAEVIRATQPVNSAEIARAPLPIRKPKPIEVEVPMDVLRDKPRAQVAITTKFETVPEAHLQPKPPVEIAPQEWSYFTPLVAETIAPAPAPVLNAQAILQPLLATLPVDAVVVSEPIAYPQYVSVGPEYFGLGSDIAPYVVSRSEKEPRPQDQYALSEPVGLRPERIAAELQRVEVSFAPSSPLPRERPKRRNPERPPAPETQIAAIVPPRPDPTPRRFPHDPAPRLPARAPVDRLVNLSLRDDLPDDFTAVENAPEPKPSRATQESAAEETTPTYRVRVEPAQPVATTVASLTPIAPIETSALPDLSIVTSEDLADESFRTPIPNPKPRPSALVQVAGRVAGIAGQPLQTIASQPANDTSAVAGCLVNRGSNERMILICEGVDISQSHVFRAVIEGESAFRGLRAFDAPEAVISTYGFNSERFAAMSQGPKSARDLAFLRALRKSGKQIRVKGRPFDMYLMKGDNSLATVLIEQVAVSEPLNAVGQ